jgi:K+-transporting ATPase KdpF subunit
MPVSACLLGLHQGLRQALIDLARTTEPAALCERRKAVMDYIVAGIASLGLFIYLIYALLRPEKF